MVDLKVLKRRGLSLEMQHSVFAP